MKRIAGWLMIAGIFTTVFGLRVAVHGLAHALVSTAVALTFGALIALACWLILSGDA